MRFFAQWRELANILSKCDAEKVLARINGDYGRFVDILELVPSRERFTVAFTSEALMSAVPETNVYVGSGESVIVANVGPMTPSVLEAGRLYYDTHNPITFISWAEKVFKICKRDLLYRREFQGYFSESGLEWIKRTPNLVQKWNFDLVKAAALDVSCAGPPMPPL